MSLKAVLSLEVLVQRILTIFFFDKKLPVIPDSPRTAIVTYFLPYKSIAETFFVPSNKFNNMTPYTCFFYGVHVLSDSKCAVLRKQTVFPTLIEVNKVIIFS